MRTLTNTPLFGMFTSYIAGLELVPGKLSAVYDDFADLIADLSQDGNRISQMRRLNYTRIELLFIKQTCDTMKEGRHVLYDVFIGKVLFLLDAEIEMVKEYLRHCADGTSTGMEIRPQGCKRKSALHWNGTDSDLIELVAALMATGAVGCAEEGNLPSWMSSEYSRMLSISRLTLYIPNVVKCLTVVGIPHLSLTPCVKAISGCWTSGWRRDCTSTVANG